MIQHDSTKYATQICERIRQHIAFGPRAVRRPVSAKRQQFEVFYSILRYFEMLCIFLVMLHDVI